MPVAWLPCLQHHRSHHHQPLQLYVSQHRRNRRPLATTQDPHGCGVSAQRSSKQSCKHAAGHSYAVAHNLPPDAIVVAVFAPTGCAAAAVRTYTIGGVTVHSGLGFGADAEDKDYSAPALAKLQARYNCLSTRGSSSGMKS